MTSLQLDQAAYSYANQNIAAGLVLMLATTALALPLEKRMEHRADEQTTRRALLQATAMDGKPHNLASRTTPLISTRFTLFSFECDGQ